MKIYTKKGDAGETGLFGGARVSKDDLRIRSYGTIDELNAALGCAISAPNVPAELSARLLRIQGELFQLGAELATPRGKKVPTALLENPQVERLEAEIDSMEGALEPLKSFILPGGSPLSSFLHLSRTICRRAERELVNLHRQEPQRALVLMYINRLSDYLFVAARWANHQSDVKDIPWNAPS